MKGLEGLEQLLAELPEEGQRSRPDLFSISGFPHYEDVLSNWYAYFMDPSGPHGLGTLFLEVLLELANAKDAVTIGSSMAVKRELTTPEGKAIDLVVHDGEETGEGIAEAMNAIVIENKVYHHLNNRLDLYFNAVRAESKTGIVLGLKRTETGHASFVSVTHRDLIDAVVRRLPITARVPEPHRQYLIDLHQNIHELTAHMEYSNEVEFFLKNTELIQRVNRLERKFKEYLKGQLGTVATELGVRLYPSAQKCWYLCLPKDDQVYYSVLLDDVLAQGTDLMVVVELHDTEGKDLQPFYDAVKPLLKSDTHADPPLHNHGANWIQYATIRIPMSAAEDGTLSETILQRIQQDLAPILEKADEFMKPKTAPKNV
ncbi:MAG: PD-(D/E)XK nuclease family protein [Flavobacteriales bacterium]|nr:PD-(D/E)XK nuclease family protein [Flavobacteriales bacterium]